MTYSPPSGWTEQIPSAEGVDRIRIRFHARRDCPAVRRAETLRPADKPYSAVRCPRCSPS
jgi:hypothetical protein